MAATQAEFIKQRPYQAVSINHFFIDILNSSRNLVVAILAIEMGLTNAQVGLALLLYNVGGSLSQPLFGWLADRLGARLFVVGGMAWMISFFGLAAIAGDWLALGALTIAGVGSGAFHPTGTMVASKTSMTHQGKATAGFFFAGQIGLFLGPVLAGILLQQFGRPGYIILPTLSLIALIAGWQWVHNDHDHIHEEKAERAVARATRSIRRADLLHRGSLLTIIILTSSTASIAAITFAPKLFTEIGYQPAYVGLLSGLFMLGSAFGGIFGGTLGDRVASKWVIILGMAGFALPLYFYVPATGILLPSLLLIAGFFGGTPHTVIVLMVQSLFPGRRALASGLALGLMFSAGAIGSYVLGTVADQIGLGLALQSTAVLPIIALTAAIFLPKKNINV